MSQHLKQRSASTALLLSRMRQRKVIPFLGAGVSIAHLGNWWGVLENVWILNQLGAKEEFEQLKKHRDPIVVAELIRQKLGVDLSRKVKEALDKGLEKDPLPGHHAIARGPWPTILTTNWDGFMERALAKTLSTDAARLTRLRGDASSVYAEVRAGAMSGNVMKLHGDFTERGIKEFVLGHRDYRRVLVREADVLTLLEHLAADHSFLFYGTSLTDPDLRACLDLVHENLGAAVGPHFWLTSRTDCDDSYAQFLLKNYAIHALVYDNFEDVLKALDGVVNEVSRPRATLDRVVYHFARCGVHLELTSEPIRRMEEAGRSVAQAISVATHKDGRLDLTAPTSMLKSLVSNVGSLGQVLMSAGSAQNVDVDGVTWWLVCGQEAGGFGRTSLVRRATLELLTAATKAGAAEIHMPLMAKGGGLLPPHEVLQAQLHAIGEYAAGKPAEEEVRVCVHSVDTQELTQQRTPNAAGDLAEGVRTHNPLFDVVEGRVLPTESVAHGLDMVVLFTVVHPDAHDVEGSRRTHHAQVCLPTDASVADLLAFLGLPQRDVFFSKLGGDGSIRAASPSEKLLDHDVTEGCVAHLHLEATV